MRRRSRLSSVLLALAPLGGCHPPVPPVLLYEGTPRPRGDVAVLEVVKTHPTRGHPTINVRKITRIGELDAVLFNADLGGAWETPGHFMGPRTGAQISEGNPRDLPSRFELLPGRYRIEFLYVPMPDRWGWTHRPSGATETLLECEAGHVYRLEGRLRGDGGGWLLSMEDLPPGPRGPAP